MEQQDLVSLTADIVAAHVANNNVAIGDVSGLIENIHKALSALGERASEPKPERTKPVVSVRASVKADHLVCMQCGSRQKLLKRHLAVAQDRKSTRLNSSHANISYAVFCLKKKKRLKK